MIGSLPARGLAGVLIALVLAGGARAADGAKPATIDRNGVLILLRTTLLAVDAANKTGNYTVLRDLAAPGFAAANNAARLGDIFAGNRRDGLDLSGTAVLDPQLTLLPEIEQNGMMRMAGFFPSVPKQLNFDLLYQPVGGQWRLFGISLNVGPSGPIAPQAPSEPPQSPDPQKPPPGNAVAKEPPKSEAKRKPIAPAKPRARDAHPQSQPPQPDAE